MNEQEKRPLMRFESSEGGGLKDVWVEEHEGGGLTVKQPCLSLEDAVKILNERKHRGYSLWRKEENDDFTAVIGRESSLSIEFLRAFEAIATAEKYEGEKP